MYDLGMCMSGMNEMSCVPPHKACNCAGATNNDVAEHNFWLTQPGLCLVQQQVLDIVLAVPISGCLPLTLLIHLSCCMSWHMSGNGWYYLDGVVTY